jgi:hypothetical protein
MPWKQIEPMEQKHRFVSLAGTGKFTVTELRIAGRNRRTGPESPDGAMC